MSVDRKLLRTVTTMVANAADYPDGYEAVARLIITEVRKALRPT